MVISTEDLQQARRLVDAITRFDAPAADASAFLKLQEQWPSAAWVEAPTEYWRDVWLKVADVIADQFFALSSFGGTPLAHHDFMRHLRATAAASHPTVAAELRHRLRACGTPVHRRTADVVGAGHHGV